MTNYEQDKQTNKDHVATPRYVVEDIYSLIEIERFENVWFPFNNYDSEFKLKAEELKIKYHATHKFDDLGNDFFTTEPPKECDLIISNPPFSIQFEILNRLFELDKPFAMLLPLSTLETEKRANLYEKHKKDLSVYIFKKRIKFKGKTTSFNTACCWVFYKISNIDTVGWI